MASRLLIVDDDPMMLQALSAMVELRLPTVTIDTCESAPAALERIGQMDYDAIVSDVKMPGMDGFQLMERVLKIRPTTPTLLVTGHGDHDMGVKALNAGAYAFVLKPIDRDFFLAWLKRAIQLRQLSRTVEQHTEELEQTVQERTADLERNNLQLQTVANQLRESEARYRSLAEAMPQIVYTTRPDGSAEYVNQRWVHYTGMSEEQALKFEWAEVLHPDDVQGTEAQWSEAVTTGKIFETEYRLRRADGEYRWYLSRAVPMRDEQGTLVKWIGTSTDIHDRKRSEEALRESEDRYKRLVKYSPDAILINRDNRIVFVNEAGLALFGATQRDQLLGTSPFDLFHPECHPLVKQRIKRLSEDGESLAMTEAQIVRLDGTIADVEVVASTFLDQGRRAIHVVLRDITERKGAEEALRKSEERFRTLADNMSQFAWMADVTGWIFWYNRRWFEYTGTTLEDMQGWGWTHVHHPDHVDRVVARIQRSWDTGEPWEDTFPLRGKDGNYRWFLSRALPIRDADGQIIRWFGTNTDVTGQRAAEEALRDHEQQLKLIADTAPVYIAHCDTEGRYKFVNKGYAERLGVRPEDCLGKRIQEVVGVQAYQSFRRYVDMALAGQSVDFEVEVPYDAIGRRFMHCSYVPERAPDGTVRGLVGVIGDITHRRDAEEALRENEERFRALVAASSDVVYRMSPDWSEMRELHGRDFIADTEKPSRTWLQEYIHPDDQRRVIAVINEAIRTKGIFELEHRVRRVDGTLGWTFSRAIPLLDAKGDIVEWFGAASDITERKQAGEALRESQAALEFTLESAQVGDWDLDLIHDTSRRSLRHDQCFGYAEPIAQWGFEIFIRHVHPEDRTHIEREFREAVSELKDWHFECRVIWPDGSVHWIAAHGSIYRTQAGKPTLMLGIVADITERKRGEEQIRGLLRETEHRAQELREKHEQLIQSAKLASIGELASGVAHELNNPLNNIGLFVGNALDQIRNGHIDLQRMRRNLETTLQQVSKAADIINHLRTFARTSAAPPEPVSLHHVIRSAVSLVESQLRMHNIELGLHPCPGDPQVQGNAIQLEQVFVNLLTNASDAVEKSAKKCITIACTIREQHVEARLTDTGAGISLEYQPRIFDPFFTTKDVGKGTGLGLSISYGIIKEHGGTIGVESEPGKGTRFTITLPLLGKVLSAES